MHASSSWRRRTLRKTAVAVFSTATFTVSLVTTAGPAGADPPPGVVPAAADIVGVGATTTVGLLNRFSADWGGAPKLYSWDGTGAGLASPITTKTGAVSIIRPLSSGQGLIALQNNTKTTVDFAASGRGPVAGDPSTDDFIGYAKDAVSWAAQSGGNAPANLSTADLKGIYNCTITKWNQITDVPGYFGPNAAVKPFLPQNGSDTRRNFMDTLGLSDTSIPPCVNANNVTDNEGSNALLNDVNVVVPYSVGHYIGQVYQGHGSGTDVQGLLTVRNIGGIAPIAADHTINSPFASSVYGKCVYNVLRHSDWTAGDAHAVALKSIFTPSTGWIATSTVAKADIKSYGFLPPGVACGVIIHP